MVDENRIMNEVEKALIRSIRKDTIFDIPYNERINVSSIYREAFNNLDFDVIGKKIKERLEEELADRIVNKVITEMGTDVKNYCLMPQ